MWLADSEDSGGQEDDTEYGDWTEREESLEGSLRVSIYKSVAYHKKGVWTFLLTAVDVDMDGQIYTVRNLFTSARTFRIDPLQRPLGGGGTVFMRREGSI